jgi:hypothetical protein
VGGSFGGLLSHAFDALHSDLLAGCVGEGGTEVDWSWGGELLLDDALG